MKTKLFKTAATILAVIMLLLVAIPLGTFTVGAISYSDYKTKYINFINDARWRNGASYGETQTPKSGTGWGAQSCCAYAVDFTYMVYGITGFGSNKYYDLSQIQTGDVIWTGGHWFIVLERDGNSLYTAEGNNNGVNALVCTNHYRISNGRLQSNYYAGSNQSPSWQNCTSGSEYGYHYNISGSNSGSGSSSSITVSWSNWAEKYSIGSNNAVLAKRIDTTGVSDGQVTEIGIFLYDNNMNALANCKNNVSYGKDSYFFAWYDVASELNYNLQPGTTYKYKMYTVIKGKTYESPVGTFTTSGSAQTVTVSWSNWAEKHFIGSNNAVLAKRIDVTGVSNGQVTEIGIILYDSGMNSLANCKDSVSYGKDSYFFAWYDVASELKYTLQAGTSYKYKMYTVIKGKTYESPVETFTTSGSAQSVSVSWSKDDEHYSVGATNAVLAKRIDLSGATVKDITSIGVKLYDNNKNLLASFNENTSYNESHTWLLAWYDVNLSTELNYTLTSGTTYKYQMYIVVKGKTYESSVDTFTTTGSAPAPSTPVPLVNPLYEEGTTVTVTWGAATNAWYYWLSIQKDGNSIVDQSVDANTSYILSNAEAGSYNVSVKAVNKNYIESDWGRCEFLVCGHLNTEKRNVIESTCTTDGYTGDVYCLDCGALLETGMELPAANHNYVPVVTEPTCIQQGYTTHTCSVCGENYIDSYINAHGHTAGEWITDTDPQIGVVGSKHKECTVCHAVLETGEIPALENPLTPPGENDPQIVVSSGRAVLGNTVNVTICVRNNPGIASAKLKVAYDTNVFTLTNVQDGGILGTSVHKPQMTSPYTLSWVNDTATVNFTADGTLATLTFAVDENAEVGNYPITITYSYDDYDIYNVDVEPIRFAVINGNIEVTDVIIGDVNGDGKVNNLDRLVLTRYLADWDDYPESIVDMIAADVNCDGKVNNLDRVILTRYLADWEDYPELPYAG